jgi:hypothetical protein
VKPIRITLRIVGGVQFFFGAVFLLAPTAAADLLHLTPAAPPWANWLLAMMAARFLGFGFGMFVAARDPHARVTWINAMIGIQAIDWVATLQYLIAGDIALPYVLTAVVGPPLFILALLAFHPRRSRSNGRVVDLAAGSST